MRFLFYTLALYLLFRLPIRGQESLAGLPQSIHNGRLGAWGLSYSNDSTFYSSEERYRKHDDFRTAGFAGYVQLECALLLAFDYSLLTDKRANLRSDELSVSLGRHQHKQFAAGREVDLTGGLGIRLADELGGESLQNSLHSISSGIDVEMPYATDNAALFAYGRLHFIHAYQERLQYELRSALMFNTDGQLQFDAQLRQAIRLHADWQLALGFRWRADSGDGLSPVGDAVLETEAAAWVLCGVSFRRFGLQVEHHLDESRTQVLLCATTSTLYTLTPYLGLHFCCYA